MVNIADFDLEIPKGDMLETIFSHQRQLMDRYHPIEQANVGHPVPSSPCEYGPHCGPLDIQDRASQLQIKSFAWRITEELSEATVCLGPETDELHYLEEMIDALHFSVELLIMSDITPQSLVAVPGREYDADFDRLRSLFPAPETETVYFDLKSLNHHEQIRSATWLVVEKLGEAANCLKGKPWKSTPMLTDEARYKKLICDFFFLFIQLMQLSNFTAGSLTKCYLSKHCVNLFRIRSNY